MKKGLTLIELLVVGAVLFILIALTLSNLYKMKLEENRELDKAKIFAQTTTFSENKKVEKFEDGSIACYIYNEQTISCVKY